MNHWRDMSERSLLAARHTNQVFLGRTHDSDDLVQQRKVVLMRDGMNQQIREINAELQRRRTIGALKATGVVIGVIVWLAGCFLAYHYVSGAAFAAVFWSGLVVLVISAVVSQIRDGIERRKRF